MNLDEAIKIIQDIFANYRQSLPADVQQLRALSSGKLYELYVLSQVLEEINRRGFKIIFIGQTLKFKGAPGMANLADSHFALIDPNGGGNLWRVFVDIEFNTLGSAVAQNHDSSSRHELDIVVTSANSINGRFYPNYNEIALGVECKSTPRFKKALLKEALDIRRELSFRHNPPLQSRLAIAGQAGPGVYASPASEYWLANPDPKILNYQQSPAFFSIDLWHLEP